MMWTKSDKPPQQTRSATFVFSSMRRENRKDNQRTKCGSVSMTSLVCDEIVRVGSLRERHFNIRWPRGMWWDCRDDPQMELATSERSLFHEMIRIPNEVYP
eukprot:5685511-Amphidinium_carterae.1